MILSQNQTVLLQIVLIRVQDRTAAAAPAAETVVAGGHRTRPNLDG